MKSTDCCMVYVTAATREEADRISDILVSQRLVACTNRIDGMQSQYWWDGAVQKNEEVVLIAKTRIHLMEEVTRRVRELHSYTCPCIVALPLIAGDEDYLQWIREETADNAME